MLRLLHDEPIAKAVALQAKGKRPSMDIQSIHDWEAGTFLGMPDAEILMDAARQRWTLVTYDQRTLWKFAPDLLQTGRELGGAAFVDEQTIPPERQWRADAGTGLAVGNPERRGLAHAPDLPEPGTRCANP